jgi:hypothetical protein
MSTSRTYLTASLWSSLKGRKTQKSLLAAMCLAFTLAYSVGPRCFADGDKAPANLPATSTSTPQLSEGDGDGDELLEHWGDPQYSREERIQLGGLIIILTAATIVAYRRRIVIRRLYLND